jgi:hypothetical protein
MKKLFFLVAISFFLSAIFFSCNKDTTVNPGGGTTGPITQSFTSSPTLNKIISNTQPVLDTIIANITDNILSNSISDIKITLGDVENVEVDKIQFSILHGGTEVMVIDYLTKTGVGSFDSTVFWDSAATPIDQGQSPYTGTFIPQQPLSSFKSADPAGQWIIKITYSGSVKSGVIKSWGITITYNKVQTPANVLVPLAVGNMWIYRTDTSGFLIAYDTMKILSKTIFNNKQAYHLYFGPDRIDAYVGNESDGLWVYGFDTIIYSPGLIWKYPINVGEWWIGGGSGNDTTVCVSIDTTIATQNGTYTGCIKFKSVKYEPGNVSYSYHYFKPGVGMIGSDRYNSNLYLNEHLRLIYIHLNP